MRAIYWFSVAGLTVGIGQIFYWLFVTQEFFPHLTLQGGYAAIAFVLGTFCVIAGALSRRRAFAVAALVTTAFHLIALGYFSFETWRFLLPELVAGRTSVIHEFLRAYAGVGAWNSFAALGHVVVVYYLLCHEFRIFGVQRSAMGASRR